MLEDNVGNKVTKRLKIEEKLRQALARSEKSCGHYKKRSIIYFNLLGYFSSLTFFHSKALVAQLRQ